MHYLFTVLYLTFEVLHGKNLLYSSTLYLQLIGTLKCEVTSDNEEERNTEVDHTVEAVGFCPLMPNVAVTASLAGNVIFWDISSQVLNAVIS